jgi:hypothetical protein
MSNSTRKLISVTVLVVGMICIGLSIYAGWSWQQMLNYQIECGGKQMETALTHTTLYACGQGEYFLGSGWFGILAPTLFAIFGTFGVIIGWHDLAVKDPNQPEVTVGVRTLP